MKRLLLVGLVVGLMALEAGISLRAQYNNVYNTTNVNCNGNGGPIGCNNLSCTWSAVWSGSVFLGTKVWNNVCDWDSPALMSNTVCTAGTIYVICFATTTTPPCTWSQNHYTCSNMTSTIATILKSSPRLTVIAY